MKSSDCGFKEFCESIRIGLGRLNIVSRCKSVEIRNRPRKIRIHERQASLDRPAERLRIEEEFLKTCAFRTLADAPHFHLAAQFDSHLTYKHLEYLKIRTARPESPALAIQTQSKFAGIIRGHNGRYENQIDHHSKGQREAVHRK